MFKKVLFIFLTFLISFKATSQEGLNVIIPNTNDKYANSVKQLEKGKTDIDYKKFRESYIDSKQFLIASEKASTFDSLERDMYIQMRVSNYNKLLKITKGMLSINYTSMVAHKILYQTYQHLGDSLNAIKYETIEMGLLKSIVQDNDGKTCATAWPVIDVDEEYFILKILGAKLIKQSIYEVGGTCDKMEVFMDQKETVYYFDIKSVIKGYEKLGLK